MSKDREMDAEQRTHALRVAILEAAQAFGTEHRTAIGGLLGDLDDAIRDEERVAFKTRLRGIGDLLRHYGAGDAWQMLYIRFGLDISNNREGWALAEVYRRGDEWKFVYGADWRKRVEPNLEAFPA